MKTDAMAQTQLSFEVQRFRDWADRYPRARTYGEWECDYEDWGVLYHAYVDHLDRIAPEQWNDQDRDALLYALARDNELERLKEELAERPGHLLALARHGLQSPEHNARWQLADALATLGCDHPEAADLLEQFVLDQDEYVRRRALLALGRLDAPRAEELALRAWDTGLEYQRIAALCVLEEISSPLLRNFLEQAAEDGHEALIANAARIHFNCGNALAKEDQFDRAIGDYDKAIQLGSGRLGIVMISLADVYFNRGNAYADKGEYARAVGDYDQAIRLRADFAVALNNRGRVKIKMGDTAGGQADIAAAKEIKPHIEA